MITVNEQQVIVAVIEHFRIQMAVERSCEYIGSLEDDSITYPTLEDIQAVTDEEVKEAIEGCLTEDPAFLDFLKMVEEDTLNKVLNYETGV